MRVYPWFSRGMGCTLGGTLAQEHPPGMWKRRPSVRKRTLFQGG
jgi:hypothetical protein